MRRKKGIEANEEREQWRILSYVAQNGCHANGCNYEMFSLLIDIESHFINE